MNGEVFFRSLQPATPIYHHIPNWHAGEGWQGAEIICNTHVWAGSTNVVGSNHGVTLPERVVAPCGIQVYSLGDVVERAAGVIPRLEVLNRGHMHLNGHAVPLRHAKKFGRPCKTCYPKETA